MQRSDDTPDISAIRFGLGLAIGNMGLYADVLSEAQTVDLVDELDRIDRAVAASLLDIELFVPINLETEFYESVSRVRSLVLMEGARRGLNLTPTATGASN